MQVYNTFGTTNLGLLLKKAVLKLVNIKAERYFVFEQDISHIVNTQILTDTFEVKEIKNTNIQNYDFSLFKNKYDRFVERLNNPSYKCYVVLKNNLCVYITWISLKEFVMPRYVKNAVMLADNEGFLFDSICSNEYRGLGLHSFMNLYRLERLWELGKSKALVLVLEGNTPAIKVQERSGMFSKRVLKTFNCTWLGVKSVNICEL